MPERLGLDLLAIGDQENLVNARQQAAREAAAKIREQTQSFIAECVTSLREQTAQLCGDMLQSIRTGETGVHQKTLNRLIRFIDQFKQMNFVGDAEMEQQLETVRRELLTRTAEEYRHGRIVRPGDPRIRSGQAGGHRPRTGPAGCHRTRATLRWTGTTQVPTRRLTQPTNPTGRPGLHRLGRPCCFTLNP